jgi:membrane fusion protein (multidrug efflux system)
MKLKSRRFGIVLLVIVVVLAVSGTLLVRQISGRGDDAVASAADSTGAGKTSAKKKKGEKEAPKPVPVETALAVARDIPAYFNATGSLDARRRIQLVSKAQGQVVKLHVEEGARVREGQVLLELDHREEELLLKEATARAQTAASGLERIRGMLDRGLGSDRDFEQARTEAEVAAAQRDLAQVRLDDKIVRAPFSGLVTDRLVEMGQTTNLGQPLVGLAEAPPLEVKLFLPEQVVKDLRTDQPVEIRPDVDAAVAMTGTVERIAPTVDPSTSTVKVTLRVDDSSAIARVGSFVRARITTDVRHGAVAVPKRALVPEAGATYVYLAEADSVRKVAVATGYADDDFVEVTDGLGLGSRIVTVGQGGLRNGSKIRDLTLENAAKSEPKSGGTEPAAPEVAATAEND